MIQKKKLYNVTFQTASGIRSRMIEAENMWQAREKIKQSYAKTSRWSKNNINSKSEVIKMTKEEKEAKEFLEEIKKDVIESEKELKKSEKEVKKAIEESKK